MVYLQRWHGWCHMKLLPPYNHVPCYFRQSHKCTVHACSAVTRYCTLGRMTGTFYVLQQ